MKPLKLIFNLILLCAFSSVLSSETKLIEEVDVLGWMNDPRALVTDDGIEWRLRISSRPQYKLIVLGIINQQLNASLNDSLCEYEIIPWHFYKNEINHKEDALVRFGANCSRNIDINMFHPSYFFLEQRNDSLFYSLSHSAMQSHLDVRDESYLEPTWWHYYMLEDIISPRCLQRKYTRSFNQGFTEHGSSMDYFMILRFLYSDFLPYDQLDSHTRKSLDPILETIERYFYVLGKDLPIEKLREPRPSVVIKDLDSAYGLLLDTRSDKKIMETDDCEIRKESPIPMKICGSLRDYEDPLRPFKSFFIGHTQGDSIFVVDSILPVGDYKVIGNKLIDLRMGLPFKELVEWFLPKGFSLEDMLLIRKKTEDADELRRQNELEQKLDAECIEIEKRWKSLPKEGE